MSEPRIDVLTGVNTAGLPVKSGAQSAALVRPIADQLAAQALEQVPHLSHPSFERAVASWAWTEAQLIRLRAWLDDHGLLNARGQARPAAELLVRLERQAAQGRERLGLDPRSRAALGKDVVGAQVDLAQLMAQVAAEDEAAAADAVEVEPDA